MSRTRAILVAAVSVLGLAACQKSPPKTGTAAPVGVPAVDDKSPNLPSHTGMTMPSGEGDNPHAGMNMHGDMGDPGGAGDEPNPHTMGEASDPSMVVAGTIELGPAFTGQVKQGDVIYVTVKAADPKTGQVAAGAHALSVDKADVPGTWPLPFSLSAPAGTQVVVTARVDRDGDGMTRDKGDLEGFGHGTAPAKDVKVVIDTPVP